MDIDYVILRKMESLLIYKDNVLDFSYGDYEEHSFKDFFSKTVKIDITTSKYNQLGFTNAGRLKCFWEKEQKELVAKVNLKLLELWSYITPDEHKDYDYQTYQDCIDYNKSLLDSKIIYESKGNVISSFFPDNKFGLFISHKNKDKIFAKDLKKNLERFGIASFVAHEDIHPSTEWVVEIEKALFSMDALVALLTKGFSESVWTNQEIGVAYGRNTFILSLRMGEDPSGFVSKFQGLTSPSNELKDVSNEITLHLLNNSKTKEKMQKVYFLELLSTDSYAATELWSEIFFDIESASNENIEILIESYNKNSQAYGCFRLNGSKKYDYPISIADKINEWIDKNKYKIGRFGKIEEI